MSVRTVSRPQRAGGRFPGVWLALLLVALAATPTSCRSTHFPDSPAAHRLARELEAAPERYYLFLANGVFSRVVGLPPESGTGGALREIRSTHWPQLDALNSASEIVAHLRGAGFAAIAEAVQTSLEALATQRPATVDAALEAGAIRHGLVQAYYGLFPPR